MTARDTLDHALLDLAARAGDRAACEELLTRWRHERGQSLAALAFEVALAETFGSCMTRTTDTPVPVTITKEN